ncbi:MAG: TRAP transporter substrate-binding protein DctP [Oscillospiraceae bacterium]|nr:TRAP transporter substrate-binding protein DctP [Oscillospiraceae bacterium]
MKKLLALLLAGAMALSMVACGGSEPAPAADPEAFEPITLKFANQHPGDGTASKSDQAICDAIEEATEGRVKVELYTDSSLGDYTSVVEEVMVGTIDMAHTTMVETYDARMSGSMLPYLGSNYDELKKAYDPEGYLYNTVFEIGQGMGIRTFGFYCEGFSGVGAGPEVTNAAVPGAEKGAIVRVPGVDTFALSARDLGFVTSTIAYSDTYTAIQTNTVQGWVGGPPNLNYLYFRDVINNYYHYMLTQEATQIYMSEKTWDKLLPEDQEAIDAIIKAECAKSFELAAADDANYMQMMKDAGINVVEFTDAERAEMAKYVREKTWPELAKNTSQEFLDNILASLE